jgi:hypothetical protein
MSAPAVRRLGDLRKADAAEVGGKAAQLGELIAAGAHSGGRCGGSAKSSHPVE